MRIFESSRRLKNRKRKREFPISNIPTFFRRYLININSLVSRNETTLSLNCATRRSSIFAPIITEIIPSEG